MFGVIACIAGSPSWAGDSSVPTDFATIQAAIDDAGTGAGDTITLTAANHVEPTISVTKAVTIAGAVGSSLTPSGVGIKPFADGITIRDLKIDGGSQSIRFEDAGGTIDATTLLRVNMINASSRGIEVHNATTVTNLLVDSCNFENVSTGLRVSSSAHLNGSIFRDSTFTDNSIGIYEANDGGSSTMKGLLVEGSTFTRHSSFGIFLEEIQDALIQDNDFVDNFRDIEIFKWYGASLPVSNVLIQNNMMTGTRNAVFAIFNAHHNSGQTVFDGVTFTGNTATISAVLADTGGAVYASAHSNYQAPPPASSLGGIGWDTVDISCNTFLGAHAGVGVRFFNPGVPVGDELGGASLNVKNNWWGTFDLVSVTGLMQIPSITDFIPYLLSPPTAECGSTDTVYSCQGFEPPMNLAYLPPALGGGAIARRVKKNRVFPFKATLVDADGNVVTDLVAAPVLEVFLDPVLSTSVDITDDSFNNGKRTDGPEFFLAGNKWNHNLASRGFGGPDSPPGTYFGIMVSGDETEYVISPTCQGVFVIQE